jgi:hypothetical protein
MLSALIVVGFLVALAGVQQCFLNQIIAADREHFKGPEGHPPPLNWPLEWPLRTSPCLLLHLWRPP